jgi:alkylation response protein AidB-like acyl-CoA dehydrogenase
MSDSNTFRDGLADELVARAQALQPLLRQNAMSAELDREVSAENIQALHKADIWALTLPKRWGGLGVSATTWARVGLELAKGCPSTAWVFFILSSGAWTASLASDEIQEDVFSDGIPRVCGGVAPPGLALEVEGGYLVTGRWPYSSGCTNATWGSYTVVRRSLSDVDTPGAVAFVPISEVFIEHTWRAAGMRGSGSHTSVLRDHFIPKHRLMPPETPLGVHTPGKKHVGAPSDYWPMMQLLRATFLGPLVGIAEAVLEETAKNAKQRGVTYTEFTRQVESQVIQRDIGEAAVKIRTGRMLMERLTRSLDAAALARRPIEYAERAANRSEIAFAVDILCSAVDKLMFIGGSSAFQDSSDLQRYWRDINIAARHANLIPNVGYEIAGRAYLGVEPNLMPTHWI